MKFTAMARSLGIFSAAATVMLRIAYPATLAVELASLESPQQPIGEPLFSILEVLIIILMTAMVALMVAVHAWAPMHVKTLSLISVFFMDLLAGETSSLHFYSRDAEQGYLLGNLRLACIPRRGEKVARMSYITGHEDSSFGPFFSSYALPSSRVQRRWWWLFHEHYDIRRNH